MEHWPCATYYLHVKINKAGWLLLKGNVNYKTTVMIEARGEGCSENQTSVLQS